jgi:hypothetical protein
MARTLKVTDYAGLKVRVFENGYGSPLREYLDLPRGTVITVDEFDTIGRQLMVDRYGNIKRSGRGWYRVEAVKLRGNVSDRALRKMRKLNRHSYDREYYVSQSIERFSRPIGGGDVYVPPTDVVVRPTFDSYNVCYVKAYDRYTALEKKQKIEQGTGQTIIGIGAIVGGLILGQSSDQGAQVVGDILTVGGAFLTAVGMVNIASADDVFIDSRCRNYYTLDTRRVRRFTSRGQSCVTRRYYSTSWNRTVEYFETTCGSYNYFSFEARREFWF